MSEGSSIIKNNDEKAKSISKSVTDSFPPIMQELSEMNVTNLASVTRYVENCKSALKTLKLFQLKVVEDADYITQISGKFTEFDKNIGRASENYSEFATGRQNFNNQVGNCEARKAGSGLLGTQGQCEISPAPPLNSQK